MIQVKYIQNEARITYIYIHVTYMYSISICIECISLYMFLTIGFLTPARLQQRDWYVVCATQQLSNYVEILAHNTFYDILVYTYIYICIVQYESITYTRMQTHIFTVCTHAYTHILHMYACIYMRIYVYLLFAYHVAYRKIGVV